MEQERRVGNEFEVTVHLVYPFDAFDRLESTLNYAEAIELIRNVMATPQKLLETVAHMLRERLAERWPGIEGGFVSVAKLQPPLAATIESVAATIRW